MKKVRNIRWHTVLIDSLSMDPMTAGALQGNCRNKYNALFFPYQF